MNEVIIREEGTLGHITLNRPEALNALTLAMILAIRERLESWTGNPSIAAVLLDGAGKRGLCAGGDIRALYAAAREGATSFPARYWREEYTLNLMIARYPKPIIAVMDGIVMGGGIGLSAHASHRLVTERSILAMPEVGIGFFPDVGGTWLLSRAPGRFGLHVALTAASLGPADAILLGLADLFVAADGLAELAAALVVARSAGDVSELLSARAARPPAGKLALRDRWINVCYAKNSVEEIVACLQERPEPDAGHAAAEILRQSPTALKVTFRALREAAHLSSLAACLDQEYRLALASVRGQDFLEGVRAAVIDKDRSPSWSPARLEDVTPDLVAARFDRSGGPELGLAG